MCRGTRRERRSYGTMARDVNFEIEIAANRERRD